jgi:hypothetical protein
MGVMKAPAQVTIDAPDGVDATMIELFGAAGFAISAAGPGQALVVRAPELKPLVGEQGAFPVAPDAPFDDAEVAGLRGMVAALAAAP